VLRAGPGNLLECGGPTLLFKASLRARIVRLTKSLPIAMTLCPPVFSVVKPLPQRHRGKPGSVNDFVNHPGRRNREKA